jgi:hypothetical protein
MRSNKWLAAKRLSEAFVDAVAHWEEWKKQYAFDDKVDVLFFGGICCQPIEFKVAKKKSSFQSKTIFTHFRVRLEFCVFLYLSFCSQFSRIRRKY